MRQLSEGASSVPEVIRFQIALMSPQESIAHYRIVAQIGVGGMGEVYRATDTKLNRDVAVKVLPESLAADLDRMARFTREAQVLASLNHPNISTIYGVEDRAIIMELVEGHTLAGPIPLNDALPLIQQLIDALEYAHGKGIVHRDLKPANIKITPEGQLKVLDFGLAKALAADHAPSDPASSPTLTIRATRAGMILGTAAYMSPEQARGQTVDKRADIWAFGAIVYELLTGKPLFDGLTVTDTLAAVLTKDPDLTATPERVRPLLRGCLERDPRQRLWDIGDAPLLIRDQETGAVVAAKRRHALPVLAVAATLAAITFGGLWLNTAAPAPLPYRFTLDSTGPVLFSPNGRWMVSVEGSAPSPLARQPEMATSARHGFGDRSFLVAGFHDDWLLFRRPAAHHRSRWEQPASPRGGAATARRVLAWRSCRRSNSLRRRTPPANARHSVRQDNAVATPLRRRPAAGAADFLPGG